MRSILLKLIGPKGAWEFFEETSPKSTNLEISQYANYLARKRLAKIAVEIQQEPRKTFLLMPILLYRYVQLVQVQLLSKNFID